MRGTEKRTVHTNIDMDYGIGNFDKTNEFWRYNGDIVTELDCHSFVYIIQHETGYYYIGKKQVRLKKSYRRNGKLIRYEKEDWQDYWGSSDEFLSFCEFHKYQGFDKTILYKCPDDKTSRFFEIREQMVRNVLYDPYSFNSNIAGRYFYNPDICKFQKQLQQAA